MIVVDMLQAIRKKDLCRLYILEAGPHLLVLKIHVTPWFKTSKKKRQKLNQPDDLGQGREFLIHAIISCEAAR